MNFGTILKSFSRKCVTLVIEGKENEARALSKKFVEYIQLKESLKRQFYVYTSLNNTKFDNKDDSELFLNETLNLVSKLNYNDIKNYNKILVEKFNIPKIESTKLDSEIDNIISCKLNENYLLVSKKTNAFKYIVEDLQRDKNNINLPESVAYSNLKILTPRHVNRIAVKKFNENYKMFTESEKKMFSIMRSSDKDRQKYYNYLLSETKTNISKFNDKCSDNQLKKLNEMSYRKLSGTFNNDNLLDLFELNETIKKYL